jgi:IS30 family transposase
MDEGNEKIISGFSSKRRCSKLEQHGELISGLLQKKATIREIVKVLSEEKQLTVVPSTVHFFLKRQKQKSQKPREARPRKAKQSNETAASAPQTLPPARPQEAKTSSLKNDWRQQVEALKQQPVNQQPAEEEVRIAPVGPLTHVPKNEKT